MSDPAPNPIPIGIIGIGSMGRGLLYQSRLTPDIKCMVICDSRLERCIEAANRLQLDYEVADNPAALEDIIRRGRLAVCEEGLWLAGCESLQVVVEASNGIGPAGEHALAVLEHRKQLVLMNAEIDLTFGPLLAHVAQKNGVICTSCDGDQYGVITRLIEELREWGFELVMAGNIKGFLDRSANPTSIIPEADKRRLDYRMCTAYTDGTKLNIEMALLANAYNLVTPVPGMRGPKAGQVREALRLFDFDSAWGAQRQPFVDYLLGAEPNGGVFAVGYCENSYQQEMLAYYKMGDGPYYLFYRPYHLCHIESMRTIRETVTGRCLLQPRFGFRTNVFAYAKTDLAAGSRLDGVGGYSCYGLIENCEETSAAGLPICLASELTLNRPVRKDQKILLDDVIYDPQRIDFQLHARAWEQSRLGRQTREPRGD